MKFAIDSASLKGLGSLRHGSAAQITDVATAICYDHFCTWGVFGVAKDKVGDNRIVAID